MVMSATRNVASSAGADGGGGNGWRPAAVLLILVLKVVVRGSPELSCDSQPELELDVALVGVREPRELDAVLVQSLLSSGWDGTCCACRMAYWLFLLVLTL